MSAADEGRLARAIALRCYASEPRIEAITQLNNAVFRLRFADGSKILKLALRPDSVSLRKELMLIDLVAQHGVPVPAVEHRDLEGQMVGRPFFIMHSAGDHTVADWVARPDETARGLFAEMGAVLARIHAITFPTSGDIRHDGIVPRDRQAYLQRLHGMADALAAQGLLAPAEAACFQALEMPSMEGGALCHSDFHAVQCIVRDGRIAAVVDWESAWAGNAIIDFAIVHAYLDYYCPPDLLRCFFDGYTSARPLPADYEQVYLPVRMAQALGLLRVWHGQGAPPNARRAAELFRAYARRLGT